MADNVGESVPENAQDLTIFVQNLLEQMVRLFNGMFIRNSIELNSCDILGEREDLSAVSKHF
jgi:hypothetical protein